MGAQIVNELTGEAVLSDREGRKYHVVFDLDAVMVVEKLTGRAAMEVIMGSPSVTDCVAMILAGTGGYARRNPGAPKVNANLAQRIFTDSGGLLKLAPILVESLSCAEGLGLVDDGEDERGTEGESGPLVSLDS